MEFNCPPKKAQQTENQPKKKEWLAIHYCFLFAENTSDALLRSSIFFLNKQKSRNVFLFRKMLDACTESSITNQNQIRGMNSEKQSSRKGRGMNSCRLFYLLVTVFANCVYVKVTLPTKKKEERIKSTRVICVRRKSQNQTRKKAFVCSGFIDWINYYHFRLPSRISWLLCPGPPGTSSENPCK